MPCDINDYHPMGATGSFNRGQDHITPCFLHNTLIFIPYFLLFLDVGLIQSMLGVSLTAVESTGEINEIAKGSLAEQFIGQHLMYDRPMFEMPGIHYWERQVKKTYACMEREGGASLRLMPQSGQAVDRTGW